VNIKADVTLAQVRTILRDTLQLGERAAALRPDSRLLGAIPEFDSMAVVTVLNALEEALGIVVDDDVTADTFETVGTLCAFVERKLAA
jgi:acyl carrier protein